MSKSWETFSKNYAKLLEEGDEYDLVINVGQEPLVKSFKAHKVILRTHSSYFYKALSKNWAKKDDGMIVFSKPNISPPVFDVILKYIYTGNADIESQDGDFILSLMTAADELLLKELVDELQDYLVNYRMEWIQENFYRVLEFAFSNPTYYGQLQDHCLGVVCADPPLLFDNERYFCGVDSVILQSLLKRDDLSMVEVELWNHLIKWAKKQLHKIRSTTAIPDDPTKWCSETMQTFQRILKDNIPFIRFTLMKPTEFREQVWPFKDCLPSQLYDAILWHYLMPESQPSLFPPRLKTIDSKLITLKHAALIATWIDRKEGKAYSHTEIPYEFNLMMRGSRDGYSQHVLHQRCAGQAKTIMLMKIKATEEIFGMFVGGIWSASISARQNDSFMFSFGEGRDTKEPVLSSRGKAAGYELALLRGQERGMDELEMFQISGKTLLSGF